MKKKIRLISNKPILILLSVILIILTAGLIVNSIALYNAIKANTSPVVAIVWISSCLIEFIIVLILMLNRHISLSSNHLTVVTGIFFNRVPYDDILLLREDNAQALLLMYYKVYSKDGEELVNYRVIPIKSSSYTEFISDIRVKNPNIAHEIFDKESHD